MATTQAPALRAVEPRAAPSVRTITDEDLRAALREGFADFREKRGDILLIGLLYPIIGFVTAMAVTGDYVWMFFPLAAGLSILGPLAATGFYELARRREAGLESSWWHFLDAARSPALDSIAVVAAVLLALFGAWVMSAGIIYAAFFGAATWPTVGDFLREVFMTPRGWAMIVVGNLVGAGFAVATLALSAISLPMLIDRDVGAGPAMGASIALVRRNPRVMLRWGATVAGLLLLGSLPLFMGLAFVLPWLGYATWHLYRRAVAD
jgi:uncharacterized membrane protein